MSLRIKCYRCRKRRKVVLSESHDQFYCFRWGDMMIKLVSQPLCKQCIKEVFAKITKALWEDKA
jgi:hypothetical protein